MPPIGLALGGGGVRGLAHVAVLKAMDAAGFPPGRIAGTSMGAIVGAMYAAGVSPAEMEARVLDHLITEGDRLPDILHKRRHLVRWIGALVPELRGRGLIHPDRLLEMLMGDILELGFEDLEVPLTVVACDYWSGEQVLFDSGPLAPAVKASMSMPGVFPAVEREGRVLVDGGLVNQVPYDLLREGCSPVVAVDVGPAPLPGRSEPPGMLDAIAGAFDIVQNGLLERRLAKSPPDVLVRTRFEDIGLLDFNRADDVLELSREPAARLAERLGQIRDGKGEG